MAVVVVEPGMCYLAFVYQSIESIEAKYAVTFCDHVILWQLE